MTKDYVPITITIHYSKPPNEMISVEPETAQIFHTSNPKKVSWEVEGLKAGDEVIVSPKRYLIPELRSIFGGKEIKPPAKTTNPAKEHQPNPTALAALQAAASTPGQRIYWVYDVILKRAGETIGYRDPLVLIDKDP